VRPLITVLLPSVALGFAVKRTRDGIPLRWPGGTVRFALQGTGGEDAPGQAERGAVRAALATWDAVASTPVQLAESDADGADARIAWWQDWEDEADALAVTIVTYDVATGEILDAEIRMNDEVDWAVAGAGPEDGVSYDVQNTVTHEVGHVLGLAHEDGDAEATMYPSSAAWETIKRDLDPDDLAGFSYLYGDRAAPTDAADPAPRTSGCSVTPGRPAGGAALAVLLALLALSRRRRFAAGAVAMLALATPAHADGIRALSLHELVARADRVVQARVIDSHARWVGETIYTDTTVDVIQCLHGPCSRRLIVRQRGGEVGGVGQSVEGTAPLPAGEEVVLFLRDRGDATRPVGMAQGVFLFRKGRAVRGRLESSAIQMTDLARLLSGLEQRR
jgi:MYXO-CTERM domain-containing protein